MPGISTSSSTRSNCAARRAAPAPPRRRRRSSTQKALLHAAGATARPGWPRCRRRREASRGGSLRRPPFRRAAHSIFPSSTWKRMGLVSKSSPPAASAMSRSLVIACALNTMIGMCRVAASRLQLPRGVPAVDAPAGRDPSGSDRAARSRAIVHRLTPVDGQQHVDSRAARGGETAHRGSARCLRPPGSSPWSCSIVVITRRPLRAPRRGVDHPSGRRTVKRDPSPGRLSTDTVPPISSQKRDTRASPSPVPPYFRVVVTSACVNGVEDLLRLLARSCRRRCR